MGDSSYQLLSSNVEVTCSMDSLQSEISRLQTEINQLHQDNEQLKQQLNIAYLIADSASVALLIVDRTTGKITYANSIAEKQLGLSSCKSVDEKGTLCERFLRDFTENTDDCSFILTTQELNNHETHFKTVNGELFGISLSSRQFFANGQPSLVLTIYDITDYQQTKENLRNQEYFLQLVLDNIPQLIFWKDRNSVFLGCNRRWSIAAGFNSSFDVIGKTDYDLYPNSSNLDYYKKQDEKIINGEQTQLQFLEHKIKPNGEEVWYQTQKIPMYDLQGNIVGLLGTIEDITKRKIAEIALQEAKDQLQAVLDAVPGAVSWIDSNAIYMGVNQYLANQFDVTPDYFVGKPVGFMHKNHTFANNIFNFLHSNEPFSSQEIMVNIHGKNRYFQMDSQRYNQGRSIVSVGIDITERKQAEEALKIAEANYRSIFENAIEGIFQTSLDGYYLRVNPALAKIHGYESPEEMISMITEIKDQVYVDPSYRETFIKLIEKEGKIKGFEYQVYRKDKAIIWVSESTRIVTDSYGNKLYYEGIIEDITQRKKEEESLRQEVKKLRIEIDQAKRQQEVAKITQADYFKEIQSSLDDLTFWE